MLCPGAAVTKTTNWGGRCKTTQMYSLPGLEAGALGEAPSSLPLPLGLRHPLAEAETLQPLPRVYLCVCLLFSEGHWSFSAHASLAQRHRNVTTSAKTLFPNTVPFSPRCKVQDTRSWLGAEWAGGPQGRGPALGTGPPCSLVRMRALLSRPGVGLGRRF